MNSSFFKNKKITVMGLGSLGGGVGVVNYLLKQKAKVLVTDLKSRKDLKDPIKKISRGSNVRYVLGRHRTSDFTSSDLIIKNPAVPRDSKYILAAMRSGVVVESDASLFFQLCKNPIIGVTGTKGKTTTVALIEAILKSAGKHVVLVGHNQISVLDRLNVIKRNSVVVFELSSWRLELLKEHKLSPHIAIITNIAEDHLNTYNGMNEYIRAKSNIFRFQKRNDFIVLNKDNKYTKKLGAEATAKRYWFSKKYFPDQNGIFIKSNKLVFRENGIEKEILKIDDIKILGEHNVENVMAAVIAAEIVGVSRAKIAKAVADFKGVKDRMEFVKSVSGKKFYNDTAATIPDATIAALNSFSGRVLLIAGGVDKDLNYQAMAAAIQKKAEIVVLLPGSATEKLKSILKRRKIKFTTQNDLKSAVDYVYEYSGRSRNILFSPGAASFNLFKNEFDRGEQFRRIVKKLK